MAMSEVFRPDPTESAARRLGRWGMGAMMVVAGLSHLTLARRAFRAQVPRFVPKLLPVSVDQVVVWSGLAEMTMGASLALLPRYRKQIGTTLAVFYVLILPGNVAQWKHSRTAFGLDTDTKRLLRLFGQPMLVAWALWSAGAYEDRKRPGITRAGLPR